ncbi:MAG: phosphate-starvation-inducible PsiE family protein [Methanomicrobiaceae archaeon]|nr:phosphate-starvation-inducible PsiE family protein [Methanomicrobiaceae archaeon]
MKTDEPHLKTLVRAISSVTVIIYLIVAINLTILAFLSFYDVFIQLSNALTAISVSAGILQVLHSLLVTIIIIEILETVTAYFRTNRVQVKPILIAGLTAMIRKVLIYGIDITESAEIILTLAAIVIFTAAIVYIGKEEG